MFVTIHNLLDLLPDWYIYQSAQNANYWALDVYRKCSIDFDNALLKNLVTCVFSFPSCGYLLTISIQLQEAPR